MGKKISQDLSERGDFKQLLLPVQQRTDQQSRWTICCHWVNRFVSAANGRNEQMKRSISDSYDHFTVVIH
jgi:hypothetical protein